MSEHPRRQQLPLPGGSANVPTGALQFQDDWPGLWLRGDAAIPLMVSIPVLQEHLKECDDPRIVSAIGRLGDVADTIERDVVFDPAKPA